MPVGGCACTRVCCAGLGSVQLEHRSLKLLRSGRLLFAEFSPVVLLWLQEQGLPPEPMPWGWRVVLPQPRCLVSEQEWLAEQVSRLPGQRQRASPERQAHRHDPVRVLLEELRGWPAGDLPPMQAVKAIQRWQVRLSYLLPGP